MEIFGDDSRGEREQERSKEFNLIPQLKQLKNNNNKTSTKKFKKVVFSSSFLFFGRGSFLLDLVVVVVVACLFYVLKMFCFFFHVSFPLTLNVKSHSPYGIYEDNPGWDCLVYCDRLVVDFDGLRDDHVNSCVPNYQHVTPILLLWLLLIVSLLGLICE